MNEIKIIIHTLKPKEKITFLLLVCVFVVSVLGALFILNNKMAVEVPYPGGAIYEGIVGTPRFLNPLIAISDADQDIDQLIYAGLLKSDGQGRLVPELAESYAISPNGLTYTFTLKNGLVWHDGQPITTEDVAFTIKAAKTPLIKSPKRANWEGVEVEVQDPRVIKFILKKPYTPFLENATLQILPKHIWEDITPDQISLSQFNIEPVGAGPYRIKKIYRNSSGIINSYALESFNDYALGKPYITNMVLNFYKSESELLANYLNNNIKSMGSISPKNVTEALRRGSGVRTMTLSRIFGVFFNQNKNKTLADYSVRKALLLATDKEKIVNEILDGYGTIISYPIPPGTFGSMNTGATEEKTYDPEAAKKLLEKSGWKQNSSGFFEKTNKKVTTELAITLSTSMTPDLVATAEMLKSMWEAIGIKTEVKTFDIGDFDKNIIRPRDYDALLFGEVAGYDPDPFAFWHSSQRNDPGLNIALYANIAVDRLLEDARATSDPKKQAQKYEAFQKEILEDIPAIFLYSPYYLYATPNYLKGNDTTHITASSERFAKVNQWYIDTKKVWKFLLK